MAEEAKKKPAAKQAPNAEHHTIFPNTKESQKASTALEKSHEKANLKVRQCSLSIHILLY